MVLLISAGGATRAFFDGGQDQVLGLLDPFLGAHDLDGVVAPLLGHSDGTATLLADLVDLAAALANDESVSARVRQGKVSTRAGLLGLGQGSLEQLLGLLYVLLRATEHPRNGSILVGSGCVGLHNVPRMRVRIGLVCNQRQSATAVGARLLAWPGWHLVTCVVDSHVQVVAKLAEELATAGDCVVQVARHLNRLALLLLDKGKNVLLGRIHIRGLTRDLDIRLAIALLGDVNGYLELVLHLSLDISAAANQCPVLLDGDVDHIRHLAFALGDNLLDLGEDLLDNLGATFNLDCVALRILLRESNGTGELTTVIGTARRNDNITKCRA